MSGQIKFLIGADPELFLKDAEGKFVSGHGRIQGTKQLPHPVKGGAVQVDGTALEFNINPASTAGEFVANCQMVREQMAAMVPGFNLVAEPVALYDAKTFSEIPDEAKELGCVPDFNAWTGDVNPRPDGQVQFRTGSGHIHIGWTEGQNPHNPEHFNQCIRAAKQMDYYLGAYSLLWDKDNTRRSLYGKAGAFRPKSYGVEYRTMSNAWLRSPMLMRWVYTAAVKGMTHLIKGEESEKFFGNLAEDIINGNEGDWPSRYDLGTGLAAPPLAKVA